MNFQRSIQLIALISAVLFVAASFHDAEARGGRGGGGGFSRGGAAASGGFSSRGGAEARSNAGSQRREQAPAQRYQSQEGRQTQHDSNQQNRQSQYDSNQQNREDRYDDAREDRQDFYEDEIDDDWDGCCDDDWDEGEALLVGAVVGGAVVAIAESSDDDYVQSTAPISALPCAPAVQAINGITYYNCGSSWYNQVYSSGGVTYIAVQPPQGY